MTRNSEATLLAKAGRYRDAFQLWCMAAEAGYDKAHYNVALCYEQGKGTKADLSKVMVMVGWLDGWFSMYDTLV